MITEGCGAGHAAEQVEPQPPGRGFPAGERHQIAAAPRARRVQGARDVAPATAGLADHQHRMVGRDEPREHFARALGCRRAAPQRQRKRAAIAPALEPVEALVQGADRLEGGGDHLDRALRGHPIDGRAADVAVDAGDLADLLELARIDDRAALDHAAACRGEAAWTARAMVFAISAASSIRRSESTPSTPPMFQPRSMLTRSRPRSAAAHASSRVCV